MSDNQYSEEIVITEHYIDLNKVMAAKGIKAPKWVISLLNRLLHVDELNAGIYDHRDKKGADFAQAVLDDLQVTVRLEHADRIPSDGFPIVAGNHPLGGPDGMALIAAVGQVRKDIVFPVNDFLMHLPALRPVFVPIDKVHAGSTSAAISAAFAGQNVLLYFPAGLCSRRQRGEIKDLDWKPTFIKQAVRRQRDIVPVYIDARNRGRFYTLANLRKMMGIKFNFEMALLPSEMYAQRGKTMRIVVGNPVSWQSFDNRHTPQEWATLMHDFVYRLRADADACFEDYI